MDSQQKTYSVMNSPLVKRRSHLKSTLGDSCHSLSNPKRVSFHENNSFTNLATIKSVRQSSSKNPGLHRYKSEWLLSEDAPMNEIKRVSSRQPRRFQSEMFLNYCDSAAREGIEMERGVPEGQEDPQLFCSVLNLTSMSNIHSMETSTISNNEMLIVKARKKQRPQSANLTKYALSLLSSMRSSLEQPKFQITLEQKQNYMKAARQRWLQPPLDLGLPQIVSLPTHCETFHDELLTDLENRETSHDIDGHIALNIAQTLGLDIEDHYKVFRCYMDFLLGKPRPIYLLLGTKALHVTFSQTHSLLWSATLFDIDQVTVRWNYSVLELKSIVSSISVQFVNSDTLRTCACSLDIILRKVKGYDTEWPIVSVETAYQLNNNWKSWVQEETKELCEQINYMGLIYWEETSLITNRESILGPYKAGYLMYRWSSSKKWHVGYFVIKAGVLYQFNHQTDRVPVFILALHGEQCKGYGRNFHSSRPHTVEIQLNNNKCLLFATASETEATDWLMILAQCAFIWEGTSMSLTEMSHSPVACAVVVTQKNVLLLQCDSLLQTTSRKCLATTPLDAIPFVTVSPGQPDDTFCVIEFDCREACEGTGDWILYFHSESNTEEFLTALRRPRQVLDLDAVAILRNKNARLRHI